VGYKYVLRRARKERICSRCGRRIRKGDLYIDYHGYGMGTCYWHENHAYCIECEIDVAKRMLQYSTKVMIGVSGQFPVPKPLTPKLREDLAKILGGD